MACKKDPFAGAYEGKAVLKITKHNEQTHSFQVAETKEFDLKAVLDGDSKKKFFLDLKLSNDGLLKNCTFKLENDPTKPEKAVIISRLKTPENEDHTCEVEYPSGKTQRVVFRVGQVSVATTTKVLEIEFDTAIPDGSGRPGYLADTQFEFEFKGTKK